MSKRTAGLIILYFSLLSTINAQNPSADWVMQFKYRIIAEAISKDGSGFVALTDSEEGNNRSVIIHLISAERKMIFKKTISFEGDLFKADRVYIHDNAKLIALSGLVSIRELPGYELPLTLVLDNSGKELWRTNSEMLGFLDSGNKILLKRNNPKESPKPCFRDDKNNLDYECLRIVDGLTGELNELITFPGKLGVFGFVEIWDDNHLIIGNQEGDIFFKNVEDITLWEKRSEGLIAKAKVDIAHDLLIVERGRKDAVYSKSGNVIWSGSFRTKKIKSEMPIDYDIAVQFGAEVLGKTPILFWKKDMIYQGLYKVSKDEINMIFYWKTFGQKFMRYSNIHYSDNQNRAIARTPDGLKLDFFNFENRPDPATANEP